MYIQELTVYPLKSAAGQLLQQARILDTGLEHDRRFVLVDYHGRFVTQRELPALARLGFTCDLGISLAWGAQRLSYVAPTGPQREIEVWGDRVLAQDWGDSVAAALEGWLGRPLRLCERLVQVPRWVDSAYTRERPVPYFFADAFPVLVIGQGSLDELNLRLQAKGAAPVPMDRFRANLVIAGWPAHREDEVAGIRVGQQLELIFAKPCARCRVPGVDQRTGELQREPLPTLSTYRLSEGKILFGQNAYVKRGAGSMLQLGDEVRELD